MVEFDAQLAAIVLAAAGVILWIATNLHFWRRTSKAVVTIKADIDAKRAATETFVRDELDGLRGKLDAIELKMPGGALESLRADLGAFEARMHAEMPPNVDGRLEELHDGIQGLANEIGKDIKGLTTQLAGFVGMQGQDVLAMQKLASATGDELKAVQAQLAPQAGQDPRARILQAITRPTPAKFAKDNPLAALVVDAGKLKLGELLNLGELGPAGAPGVQVRRTSNMEF